MARSRIGTDSDYVVTVEEDSEGVLLGIAHGIGSTQVVLRPAQAERLAAELLAYANGDHLLPPDAVRPRRIAEARATPALPGEHWMRRAVRAERLIEDCLAEIGDCSEGLAPDDLAGAVVWMVREEASLRGALLRQESAELEARQNELYEAMRVVEEMPAGEAQTAAIVRLGERMRLLVERLGKSEVGRNLDV